MSAASALVVLSGATVRLVRQGEVDSARKLGGFHCRTSRTVAPATSHQFANCAASCPARVPVTCHAAASIDDVTLRTEPSAIAAFTKSPG